MYPEPRILPAHVIIDVNYHQYTGKENIKKQVADKRNIIGRNLVRKISDEK